VRAFESGALDTEAGEAGHTLATGLNVPGGVGHFRVLQIIRASAARRSRSSEADIAASSARLARDRRDWISPEGAACLAALPQLLDRGLLQRGERVVAVNTGSAEKVPRRSGRPVVLRTQQVDAALQLLEPVEEVVHRRRPRAAGRAAARSSAGRAA
jgi:threonine synthase